MTSDIGNSSSKKRHQCSVCQKKFGRPSALLTHMYTHTGERPFKCHVQGCGRDFTVQSNLRRHLKVHSPSPSPRRRLSAQMRYQYLKELMEKRERSFMTMPSCTAEYHHPPSSVTLPTQSNHDPQVSSSSSSPISPSSSPKSVSYYNVDKWLNPPSSNMVSNNHPSSTQPSNPVVAPAENSLPFILLQYPRSHSINF
ncbi:hypothetical protein K492DRAFT_206238 [Lichtheimia hyalospora FSU 10163]|nr:hypothetical protein K492DRAFT_206238 [Lichtheimia hyalospora FSU 10163]